jgi:hypothetical protein
MKLKPAPAPLPKLNLHPVCSTAGQGGGLVIDAGEDLNGTSIKVSNVVLASNRAGMRVHVYV